MVPLSRSVSSDVQKVLPSVDGHSTVVSIQTRFGRVITLLSLLLISAALISLCSGYRMLHWRDLFEDSVMQTVMFRLRIPRVLLAAVVGASLSVVGAALQSMFRNPLAEP